MTRSTDGFTANPGSSPSDVLQLILAAAAFDQTAQTSAAWAPTSEQVAAATMFTSPSMLDHASR